MGSFGSQKDEAKLGEGAAGRNEGSMADRYRRKADSAASRYGHDTGNAADRYRPEASSLDDGDARQQSERTRRIIALTVVAALLFIVAIIAFDQVAGPHAGASADKGGKVTASSKTKSHTDSSASSAASSKNDSSTSTSAGADSEKNEGKSAASGDTAANGSDVESTGVDSSESASASEPEAEDVSDILPYRGMSVELIDETWLGPHDEAGSEQIRFEALPSDDIGEISRYRREGKNTEQYTDTYIWLSKNGKDQPVFTAYVYKRRVVKVTKHLSSTDYWPSNGPDTKPDLYASGTSTREYVPSRPQPGDYDNPDEYVADLEAWREYTGDYSDGYEDPYDDWDLDR